MATKLLLIEDVEDLGRKGEIVAVREGYARNYLLPRSLGIKADRNALRRQAALQEARNQQAIVDKAESEKLAAAFINVTLLVEVKVDPEGHMYGSVSQTDVVRLMKEQQDVELDKKFIALKHPIKTIGLHSIELKLKEGVPGKISLRIYPEGADLDAIVEAEKVATTKAQLQEEPEVAAE